MITVETEDGGQYVRMVVDAKGVEDLIGILKFIQRKNDHMHLNIGHHLTEIPAEDGFTQVRLFDIYYDENAETAA